jgi:hypothetical protein
MELALVWGRVFASAFRSWRNIHEAVIEAT